MYKNRLNIWVAVLCIYGLIMSMISLDIDSMIVENNMLNIYCDTDSTFKSVIQTKIPDMYINTVSSANDADVIIRSSDISGDIPGFTKTNDYIFSPIVIFAPTSLRIETIESQQDGNSYKIIMNKLADAVINENTLEEFKEVNDDYKKNKICFGMPSEGNFYYEKALEQIYVAMNNNKVPTEKEKDQLKSKVDELMAASFTCNDIGQHAHNLTYGDMNFYIGPEYLIKTDNVFSSATNQWYFSPVYFDNSVAIKYDIYVKNNDEQIKEKINSMIIQNEYFVDNTSYRTSYSHNYCELMNCSRVLAKDVKIIGE